MLIESLTAVAVMLTLETGAIITTFVALVATTGTVGVVVVAAVLA